MGTGKRSVQASRGIRINRASSIALLAAVAVLAIWPTMASANEVIAGPGEAAGQVLEPQGIAVDNATGKVYVADAGNNRIDVFGPAHTFEEAMGWGVADGQSKFEVCTAVCHKGIAGGQEGQFSRPTSVAVDPVSGDIYVGESAAGNPRVQKIDPATPPAEAFVLMIGGGVNKTTGGNLCTAASGDECQAAHSGLGPGEFTSVQGSGAKEGRIYVGVGEGGKLFALDASTEGEPGDSEKYELRVQRFSSGGTPELGPTVVLTGSVPRGLAVEPSDPSEPFWVIGPNKKQIAKFSADASLELPIIIGPREGLEALGVDAAGSAFVDEGSEAIAVYSSAGALTRRFGYEAFSIRPAALAPTADGSAVYFSEEQRPGHPGRLLYIENTPSEGPIPLPCNTPKGGLGNVKAELVAQVNPEGEATTYHFELVTKEQFDLTKFEEEESVTRIPANIGEDPSLGAADFELHSASVEAEALRPSTKYVCRVVAEAGGKTAAGKEENFETLPPVEIKPPPWATDAGPTSAVVHTEVNPLGIPTSAYFEYVTSAQFLENGFAGAQKSPDVDHGASPLDLGDGNSLLAASVTLEGLTPSTEYHYRLVALDSFFPAGIAGPSGTFTTSDAQPPGIADGRHYELVSPAEKESAEVGVPGPAGGLFQEQLLQRIIAAAADGERVTYTSFTSFGDPKGAPGASQYLSRRTPTGWQTENISPFGFENGLQPPYRGFTQDLKYGGFVVSQSLLTGEAQPGIQNLYFRNDETGGLQALTVEPPSFTPEGDGDRFCTAYAGSSTDGTHAFFAAKGAMAGAPSGKGFSLYEWSAAKGLSLVSIFPDGTPAPPRPNTGFGMSAGACTIDQRVVANAVSEDGLTAFWTYAPLATEVEPTSPGSWGLTIHAVSGSFTLIFMEEKTPDIAFNAGASAIQSSLESLPTIGAGNVSVTGSGPFTIKFIGALSGTQASLLVALGEKGMEAESQLYARLDGSETVQADGKPAAHPGNGPFGQGHFWAATPDGKDAFFTAKGRLTSGSAGVAGAEGQLYRFSTETRSLTDLTPGVIAPKIQGVIGTSRDGSYVYFVANGVLTGTERSAQGEQAVEDANNLYLYHEGEGIRFITTLSNLDEDDWSTAPEKLTARVTPDGKHLAFLSTEASALAGYDNIVASGASCQPTIARAENNLEGDPHCPEAFLYSAEGSHLVCASCNPTGARPEGPAQLPAWTNPLAGPRYLSDDGNRLFFESRDALVGEDENGRRDVYEYEHSGSGTCTASNSGYSGAVEGCITLISSGRSSSETYLVDASSSGRDVFFSTRAPLVGWDENENYDVYDAREGGGFPEPPVTAQPCSGESCKAPSGPAPGPSSAATSTFVGHGNPKSPRPCPKGRVHKGKKCVKKPKKKNARSHKRKPKGHKTHGKKSRKGGA